MKRWFALSACGALTVMYGAIAMSAAVGKSPTFDEPLHMVGGIVKLHHGDYRIDAEAPPILGFLAALPHSRNALRINTEDSSYRTVSTNPARDWDFVNASLFPASGPAAPALVNRSRAVFTLVAVLFCLLMAAWAHAIAGVTAAIVATALFALDPNLLAHGPIVKNDIPLGLFMFAAAYGVWRLGLDGRRRWVALIAVAATLAVNVKFSGVLLAPLLALLLAARALIPGMWPVAGRRLTTVSARASASLVVALVIGASAWGGTWAIYRFRFSPMTDGGQLSTSQMMTIARANELRAASPTFTRPTRAEFDAAEPSAKLRALLWVEERHLLPQGWTYGFLYTYATTLVRPAYLMGNIGPQGWWYYFPIVMALKTPIATLLALVIALGFAARAGVRVMADRRGFRDDIAENPTRLWTGLCLAVPAVVFMVSALGWKVNIGVRHILPVYPVLYLALGVLAAHARRVAPRRAKAVLASLAVLLVAETGAAYPHFIPFFNAAALRLPNARNGIGLLGDSNLDWGQDLPLLARWREAHRDRPLMLSYFGTVDPASYGIDYVPLPYNYQWGPPPVALDRSGYIAVSANNLQGTYIDDAYRLVREQLALPPNANPPRLIAVLGKSIYVYEWTR